MRDTEERELVHPGSLLHHPFFRSIYGKKKKENEAYSEEAITFL
jgi:hypothetical protein